MHTWFSVEELGDAIREARIAEAAHERLLREARRAYRPQPAFALSAPGRLLAAVAAGRRMVAGWTGARLIRLGETLESMAAPPDLHGCDAVTTQVAVDRA